MNVPPAQLWIGSHPTLIQEVISYLHTQLCSKQCSNTCIAGKHIVQKQHHAITWLMPDVHYAIEQIIQIQQRMSFTLEPSEKHFFVIQHAESLSLMCSNRLLKSIEEPPEGYHFLLLTQQKESIIKTVQSRCTIKTFFNNNTESSSHPLYTHFTHTDPNPSLFEKDLLANTPNERESVELVHKLFQHWASVHKNTYATFFSDILKRPPMPGSAKLFWKNVFLCWISHI